MTKMDGRIHAIDGIRGFSLLGILLANMLIFQYGIWGSDAIHLYSITSFDQFMYGFTKIVVVESFMPIFTFLFGYSMVMMKDSLDRKGLKMKSHFIRRAIFLLILGLLHSTFLWEGDILLFYGLMTFALLLFLNRKRKTILIWGISLFTLMLVTIGVGSYFSAGVEEFPEPKALEQYVEKTIDVYGTGTYGEIMYHRNNEDPLMEEDPMLILFITLLAPIYIAPMFLFGMYAAKKKWFFNPVDEAVRNRIVALILVPTGIILKALYYFDPTIWWAETGNMLGANLLAFGYIFLIAFLYNQGWAFKWLKRFESVGKLSLTNYLLQSVICTTIFYGYGIGLFGKMGVGIGMAIGLCIYFIQLFISQYYLTHLRFGPFEKVNRIWTYFTFKKRNQTEEGLSNKKLA